MIMYVISVVTNSDSADDSNFLWLGELCRIVMTLIIILRLLFGLIMSWHMLRNCVHPPCIFYIYYMYVNQAFVI